MSTTSITRAKLESRLNRLESAAFYQFHDSCRLFFDHFDGNGGLSEVLKVIGASSPEVKGKLQIYLNNSNEPLSPGSEQEAAAIGECFLRMISTKREVPRALYDSVYARDLGYVDSSPQHERDERMLKAVKDQFLVPFALFLLDSFEENTPKVVRNTADIDPLLGFFRKEVFEREKKGYFSKAVSSSRPLSLIFADIDNFKQFNSNHGQEVGDAVLSAVAECFLSISNERGFCYRIGGEELCVILENFESEEAKAFAERVRRTVESLEVTAKKLSVTASFGVATYPSHGNSIEEIYGFAEEAQKSAKKAGKNRVVVYGTSADLESAKSLPLESSPRNGLESIRQAAERKRFERELDEWENTYQGVDEAVFRFQSICDLIYERFNENRQELHEIGLELEEREYYRAIKSESLISEIELLGRKFDKFPDTVEGLSLRVSLYKRTILYGDMTTREGLDVAEYKPVLTRSHGMLWKNLSSDLNATLDDEDIVEKFYDWLLNRI